MANLRCKTNGTVDDTGYSSPVPIIGLYIAAATLLRVLLMLCDIVTGIRARKRWLPCNLFKLNSITLTLFSIATKLPVDLTTPMPSPRDQLSKLSGTTFIFISMCFLMPSLGDNPESESFTNLVALTIFVVTISVNVCMQLSTGVIALFFIGHIIILCSLILLLLMMWKNYWVNTRTKKFWHEENREIFTKGDGSVFQRLKTSYVYGYCKNSQLVAISDDIYSCSTFMMCTLCCATLIQAAFRTLIQKQLQFCSGKSDYDWSMSLILVTQILTVILGNLAVMCRFLIMSKHQQLGVDHHISEYANDVIQANPLLGTKSRLYNCGRIVQNWFLGIVHLLAFLIGFLPSVATVVFWGLASNDYEMDSDEWVTKKSNEDVEIWIDQSKSKHSNIFLSQLLISRYYPYQKFDTMEVIDPSLPDQKGVYASSLSIVLLIRAAQICIPMDNAISLGKAFNEVKEVIYYIEKRINSKSFKNDDKLVFAEAAWSGEGFSHLILDIFRDAEYVPYPSDLDSCQFIISSLKNVLPLDSVSEELGIIIDFILRKSYITLEEYVMSVEQLFVDMVRVILAQLPNAIFKSLCDSSKEENEENVKLALKITCKVEWIEEVIRWSFPLGCNFTSLLTTEFATQLDAIP